MNTQSVAAHIKALYPKNKISAHEISLFCNVWCSHASEELVRACLDEHRRANSYNDPKLGKVADEVQKRLRENGQSDGAARVENQRRINAEHVARELERMRGDEAAIRYARERGGPDAEMAERERQTRNYVATMTTIAEMRMSEAH